MVRSFPALAAIALTAVASACSLLSHKPEQKPLPVVTVRTATMDITPGIKVLARIALAPEFAPSPDYPPMWLQGGKEIGVAGSVEGRSVIVGYSASAWQSRRVLAEDGGTGAPNGHIVNVAPSPDGLTLALAVADRNGQRVEVMVRDLIAADSAYPAASFDGEFDGASVAWLDQFTIAVVLGPRTTATEIAPASGAAAAPGNGSALAASGLYAIGINGILTADYLKLDCKLSALKWSPHGDFAVGEGSAFTPAVLVDRRNASCQQLIANPPIRLLGWSRDGKSFLFEVTSIHQETASYSYDIASQRARLVAVSSGAAAFIETGDVLALGNSSLTFGKARDAPLAPVIAQLATSNESHSEIDINSLGFNTTAALLAESSMTYNSQSKYAAMSTFSPSPSGPSRKVVVYSVPNKNAFLVAFGPARGPAPMSWSPQGRYLAIVDGGLGDSALTIISPP